MPLLLWRKTGQRGFSQLRVEFFFFGRNESQMTIEDRKKPNLKSVNGRVSGGNNEGAKDREWRAGRAQGDNGRDKDSKGRVS